MEIKKEKIIASTGENTPPTSSSSCPILLVDRDSSNAATTNIALKFISMRIKNTTP